MSLKKNTSIFFVASPLQALAAQRIAENFDKDRAHLLVYYKKKLDDIVNKSFWTNSHYMPWPRHEPEPGLFGVQKKLIKNLFYVNNLVYDCDSLFMYSAVYDTEAINYFVSFFQIKFGHNNFSARILPDGVISSRKYPLTLPKRILKLTRSLRRVFNTHLRYSHFSGDRIGSDANFIDLIYVLDGMPHKYDKKKVIILPPLVAKTSSFKKKSKDKIALIIGQPLKGFNLMSDKNIKDTSDKIFEWLKQNKILKVFYKNHPKDNQETLNQKDYHKLSEYISIEIHLAENYYDYIIGVNSSVLLLAKQICGENSKIISFGLEKINYKSIEEEKDFKELFKIFNIEIIYI